RAAEQVLDRALRRARYQAFERCAIYVVEARLLDQQELAGLEGGLHAWALDVKIVDDRADGEEDRQRQEHGLDDFPGQPRGANASRRPPLPSCLTCPGQRARPSAVRPGPAR